MNQTRTLAILIFDDVEVLDFCGPFEVFSVANRFTDPPAFNVLTVAEKAGPVVTRGGLSVNPHHRLADCPQPDRAPGPRWSGHPKGDAQPGADRVDQAGVHEGGTGLVGLHRGAAAGEGRASRRPGGDHAPRGHRPTAPDGPEDDVHADRRFVDNGRVICSAGIAAGIDMSLHVVSRLLGDEVAEKSARQMEYPWSGEP